MVKVKVTPKTNNTTWTKTTVSFKIWMKIHNSHLVCPQVNVYLTTNNKILAINFHNNILLNMDIHICQISSICFNNKCNYKICMSINWARMAIQMDHLLEMDLKMFIKMYNNRAFQSSKDIIPSQLINRHFWQMQTF